MNRRMTRRAIGPHPCPHRGGPLRLTLTLLLSAGHLLGHGRALASGEGQSKSDSGNSGSNNSSKGSGDSSQNSGDSSKSSNDSSKSSNDSTEASPQKSADSSSEGTVNSSTKSRGAQTFWAGSAVVLLGASVVGTVLAARSRAAAPPPAAVALAAFMRENHAVLTHDVALAHGPVFDAWARELGLTPAERGRVAVALEGSREQGELLSSLDGSIDAHRARRFSAAFFRVTARALGPAGTERLLARAARAGQPAGPGAAVPPPLPPAATDHAG